MRIKSFTGSSMSEAMDKVRTELGDEAIILATQELPAGGSQVTAAIERPDPQPPTIPPKSNGWASDWDSDWKQEAGAQSTPKPKQTTSPQVIKKNQNKQKVAIPQTPEEAPLQVTPRVETLVQAMAYHGIPTLLAERICRSALSVETDDITMALAASLDKHFNFSPRFSRKNVPLMLIGPPGVGKTMTIAKMAASATLEGRKVHVVTTDKSRAGAVDQLKAFTDILKLQLWVADGANDLAAILAKPELQDGSHILIDTGGINCYETTEIENLAAQIVAGKAETVIVLPAGTDAAEMSDTAEKFAAVGAKRIIVTRLDTTRRYGGIFTAADKANLSFSYASVSPSVATGLHIINPVNLARLLLRDPNQQGISNEFDKAKK
ncbi:MAG: AAA family ATPase [Sneathiella sp.]